MSALIRETPFGKLVHFLARGKILKYPEEVDGFVVPASMLSRPVPEKQQSQQSHDENETETVVGSDAGGAGSPGAAEKGMNFGAGDKPPKRPQPSRHESMASAAEIGEVLQQSLSRQLTRHGEVARAKCDPMSAETIIVTWYGDDDPDNPQNWSHWKKSLVTFTICVLTFSVYTGSSLITSGFGSLMAEFGINEQTATVSLSMYVVCYGLGALIFSPLSEIPALGRNPFYWAPMIAFCGFQAGLCRVQTYTGVVLLRMLTAFCGGPVLSTGGATLADIYNPFQIPTAFSIWVLPAFSAPALGPTIGNFAAQAHDWRWPMWELLWLGGFSTILLVFLLPETSHANILLRRAERLRALTGNLAYRSQEEITNAKRTPGLVFQEAILRPFQITVLDPSIGFANVYTGLVYAFYYTFFVAFPIVYGPEVFNFSFGAQGVVYVSIIVGGIVGFIIYVGYQLLYMNGYWYPTRGWPVNEKRLEPAIISSAFAPIGLFIFAWTSRVECHWIGSCIGTALYALSNFITLQCIFFYIVLSYPAYAASILAANDLLRATAATGFLHIGIPMFRTLHIDGGVSLLAGLTCFGVPGIYLIYRYGARLRAKSRFAVGDSQ